MVDPPDLGGLIPSSFSIRAIPSTTFENGQLPQPDSQRSSCRHSLLHAPPVSQNLRVTFDQCTHRKASCNKIPYRFPSLVKSSVVLLTILLSLCVTSSNGHVASINNDGLSPRDIASQGEYPLIPRVTSRDSEASLAYRPSLTARISKDDDSWSSNYFARSGLVDDALSSLANLPSVKLFKRQSNTSPSSSATPSSCEHHEPAEGLKVVYGLLVPILVLLSGVFAGLTLGYMSLDETQLSVLMTTGDTKQRERARKIMPIRKDGHLLLTTLLIANMITNETLPVIFDPLLPGGVYSVIISTVLIVIFSELIPQSTCSRYGLQIGAVMAYPTRIIILIFWPVAYPVSRILHYVLGPHHGIVYRRAELKELVTMHAASGGRGGDLNRDTVMIVGGALDLQEKVVKEAMTPIDKVFMLPFTAKLDYPTLERVVRSGHSRIPIYQEIEVPIHSSPRSGSATPKRKIPLLSSFSRKNTSGGTGDDLVDSKDPNGASAETDSPKTKMRKKIIGTLLVKACVLLDPEDAVPVSSMVINALPSVTGEEPLLNVLNVFQEGRSHMAIVYPRQRRGMSESIADLGSKSNLFRGSQGPGASAAPRVDGLGHIDEEKNIESGTETARRSSRSSSDPSDDELSSKNGSSPHSRRSGWRARFSLRGGEKDNLEQTVPADATIDEKKAQQAALDIKGERSLDLSKIESRQSLAKEEDDGLPIGIITLEDVLEELLCEEILDEYDDRGNEEEDFRNYIPPPSPVQEFKEPAQNEQKEEIDNDVQEASEEVKSGSKNVTATGDPVTAAVPPAPRSGSLPSGAKKTVLGRLGIGKQKSGRGDDTPDGEATSKDDGLSRRRADTPLDESYFAERRRPTRSSSVPPENERNSAVAHTEMPPSAGDAANGTEEQRQAWTSGLAASGQPVPALVSPQPNRPLVVRTQALGGGPKTTIASENYLRGRTMAVPPSAASQGAGATQAQPANAAAFIAPAVFSGGGNLTPTSSSRSQTPVGGNRGHRFKSQAVLGVGSNAAMQAGASGLQPRIRPSGPVNILPSPTLVTSPVGTPTSPHSPDLLSADDDHDHHDDDPQDTSTSRTDVVGGGDHSKNAASKDINDQGA